MAEALGFATDFAATFGGRPGPVFDFGAAFDLAFAALVFGAGVVGVGEAVVVVVSIEVSIFVVVFP